MNFMNEMRIEFLSKSQNEAFARVVVAAFVAQLDPTIEEITDIKTAVSKQLLMLLYMVMKIIWEW